MAALRCVGRRARRPGMDADPDRASRRRAACRATAIELARPAARLLRMPGAETVTSARRCGSPDRPTRRRRCGCARRGAGCAAPQASASPRSCCVPASSVSHPRTPTSTFASTTRDMRIRRCGARPGSRMAALVWPCGQLSLLGAAGVNAPEGSVTSPAACSLSAGAGGAGRRCRRPPRLRGSDMVAVAIAADWQRAACRLARWHRRADDALLSAAIA